VALVAAADARAEEPRTLAQLESWAEGPVRWLLQPSEWRELKQVDSSAEALNFIDTFWRRRDPDPQTEGNIFRETFFERVEAADLLYADDGRRGSLTDRGRALILLGPPSGLRVAGKRALKWEPESRRRREVAVRILPMEVWSYRVEDFPVVLRQALSGLGEQEEIQVSFVLDKRRTYIGRGEEFLELAAEVALARPH